MGHSWSTLVHFGPLWVNFLHYLGHFGPYLDHPNRQRNVRRRFKRRARVAHSARVGSHGRSAGRNILLPPQSISLHYPSHDSSSTSPGLAPLTKYIYLVGVRRNYRAGYFFGFVCGSAYCVGSVYFIHSGQRWCAPTYLLPTPTQSAGRVIYPTQGLPGPPWEAPASVRVLVAPAREPKPPA